MTPRSLADWLSYLEQLHPSAIDMGLERSREVASRLGLGKLAPLVITVTGTNGKGSTCAMLAELLREQGLKVGIYSSPHLLRYNERVRFDDREASDTELCEAFSAIEARRGEVSLTYFEMGTLAAFWLFQHAALDAVVLEVGLGGRLDAVNLVDADLALVTSIGLDHAEWLGDTRESVAFEKAGILRQGKPALCGDLDPPLPLLQRVSELDCPLFLRGRDYDLAVSESSWDWRGLTAAGQVLELRNLPLLDLPLENAALALQAYAALDMPWQAERLAAALRRAQVSGRLERRELSWRGKTLALLLDVGHNPHAAEYLSTRLAARPVKGRRLAVFGLLADKDLTGVLAPLQLEIQSWAVTPLACSRARPAGELEAALHNLGAEVQGCGSVAEALLVQCGRANEDDEILVFGSFYCVAEALEWLDQQAETGNGSTG